MADARLAWLPATELAALIRKRQVSPVEVIGAVLDRIDTINPRLNAFVTLTDEQARRQAKAAERALMKRGAPLGPLQGGPFSVKALVITRGVRTTFGTPLYRGHVPTEDAPMVERMKAAGGIMLGKTNTPTFGWLGATHNLVFGITRNPWNLERTPGGSSGGASAAAAAGLGPLHIGTDGGGSIRIPASCAGIFGHKASYGRIPTYPASRARRGERSSAAASPRGWRRTSIGAATSSPGSTGSSRRHSRTRRRSTCRRGSIDSRGGSIRACSSRSTISC